MRCNLKLRSNRELENVWYNIKEGIAATIFGIIIIIVVGWLMLGFPAGLSYLVQGVTDEFHWSLYLAAILDALLVIGFLTYKLGSVFLTCEKQ